MNATRGGPATKDQKRALLAQRLREEASRQSACGPPSHGQEALWFLYRSAPQSAAYNIGFAIKLLSSVDLVGLRETFQRLVARHGALRTTFHTREGNLVREVHGYLEVPLSQQWVVGESWEAVRDRVVEDYQRPFDLERAPAMRASLFTRSEAEHVLLLTMHHISGDAWSFWILIDELVQLYSGWKEGVTVHLRPVEAEYGDFVLRQRSLVEGEEGDRLSRFWKQQLAGELPILNLVTDHPRPALWSYRGSSYFFDVPEPLMDRLRELARAEGVTLFVLLLAAYQVLLHRHTDQDDLIVGSPMNGRVHAGDASVVGYFVNPVALRANFAGNPPFREFLATTRRVVVEALTHQEFPFPLLVHQLQPVRDPGRAPVFQTMFVFQKPQPTKPRREGQSVGKWGALEVAPFEIPQMEGQFDLMLEMMENRQAIFKYNSDLFLPETIRRFGTHFVSLLEAIAENPSQRIGELNLMVPDERELLAAWNRTARPYQLNRCLHHWVEDQVARTPNAPAVRFRETAWNYHELNARANRLAHGLRKLGVGPEVMVGVCMERSLEMVVALLAILKAGGAYVPVDPTYPPHRVRIMIEDSQVKWVLSQKKFADLWDRSNIHCLTLDSGEEPWRDESSANLASVAVGPSNAVYMIYTSGSTGEPKGAINLHAGVCNRLLWMQDAYPLTPSDCVLQKTPFSFDVSVWEFFWPLMTGACLVMADPGGHQDAAYLVRLIRRCQVTTVHFVPSMLTLFLQWQESVECRSLRQVICSGEVLPLAVQERFHSIFPAAALHNLYGPTEAAVDVTAWHCKPNSGLRFVPIGRPIANIRVHLLDRHMRSVPIGIPGELHIGGVGVARGYWRQPELSAEKFVPDPFSQETGACLYKTGDLARYSSDGVIEFLGRIDQQVKLRGFRIELDEITTALKRHPALSDGVVVVRGDSGSEAQLVAYVVPAHGAQPTKGELREFLGGTLPSHFIPDLFEDLPALPRHPNGKLDRKALPAPKDHRRAGQHALSVPQTQLERQLAEVWSVVLGVTGPGVHENFFDLGGHSLRLGQVHAQIEERLGFSVSLLELFHHPTIHTLAQFLAASDSASPGASSNDSPSSDSTRTRRRTAPLLDQQQVRQRHRTNPGL